MDVQKYQNINPATSVQEALKYEGMEFIYCVYRTFLNRDPDPNGLNHFYGKIQKGYAKRRIIIDIINSPEGQQRAIKISGQDALIKESTFAKLKRKISFKLNHKTELNSVESAAEPTHKVVEIKVLTEDEKLLAKAYQEKLSKILEEHKRANPKTKTLWFDLTTSMLWRGGVVGIIRAELEMAAGLHKLDQMVRFSMLKGESFEEIPYSELDWLFTADNVVDAYMNHSEKQKENEKVVSIPNLPESGFHPYAENDIIFSAGWMDSEKENIFTRVKTSCKNIKIGYLVYDTILANEDTSCFYQKEHQVNFLKYIKWISNTCDFIIFGGEVAKADTAKLQQKKNWRSPRGSAVQFGTDIAKNTAEVDEKAVLEKLGLEENFIITVGTLEPRKNHDTLYKAYLAALKLDSKNLPQLVICGRPMDSVKDLVDSLERDPRIQGKIIKITPTDMELAVLYRKCLFTVLPSVYEGWSLTLPESLGQNKFCLCSDTPPLKEIGKDMIDYVAPFDVMEWARKILFYSSNKNALHEFENKIKQNWKNTKWLDTSKQVLEEISAHSKELSENHEQPEIWFDLTVSFLYWNGGLSGIIRSELTFAKYLFELSRNVHFFAWSHNQYFEIKPDMLEWLFDSDDLSESYKSFHEFWHHHETAGTGHRNRFHAGAPSEDDPGVLRKFPDNAIVLFTCIDWDQSRIKAAVEMRNKGNNILLSHLVYDMTPFLVPHLHAIPTCEGYRPFIEYVSNHFDHIVYGGKTALRDSVKIQKENMWGTPPSDYIEFGSDIHSGNKNTRKEEVFQKYGVSDKYILTVGTIEPRKNHETLYKAYLMLLSKDKNIDLPMLVIIGKKGWKSDNFMSVFELDERIKNKIIIISPNDMELDVLYRNCMFTVLPSFYEGWSLTLPESLSYGKFCLTSKVDPLIETGRDLVEYIDPLDTAEWGNRILFYFNNMALVQEKENYIAENWKPKSWKQSAKWLLDLTTAAHKEKSAASTKKDKSP